ncbi:telomere-associated protein RIF1 [Thalassophryne amazonica]|uniref:telomere-associated protein RIF1 n=1 Tax=Thalassophryne amazonica TaxID=390379 RepID=UPI0014715594|nr:telomere-associated protein RIF1 [Thalassophryne amazonica]
MMAAAGPPCSSSFLLLLESLEDTAAAQSEQTDAYLTIANRLSGEEGRQFLPAIEKHFARLAKTIVSHMSSSSAELSQAALQALGFCVYHSHVVSGLPENVAAEILSELCSLVVKSTDKNTCTRALWVISKQSFCPEVVSQKASSVLGVLENVWSREDVQSVVMEHEALNVVIRMLEQVPQDMATGAVRWAKLVIPLVVHSAPKVRLRAAAAMEMGMPVLLEKQMEVATVIEPMMSSKLIPELQKLFMSRNETNVLKLWPLFVRLLGKILHRGGPFINSLLHLEELGFRTSSPTIKKIAFIAWKSLIDNFALNPDILCSAKRMKLLMQPLTSIHVRTEALMLTKLEVWWYLVVQLGPNLASNFEQVSVPLLQCAIGTDLSTIPGAPRASSQNGAITPGTPKTGSANFPGTPTTPRMNLNASIQTNFSFPSVQLLGLEMLLHYFLGPEIVAAAAENKLVLSLESLNHPFLSGTSTFSKHAAVLICSIRDCFTAVGKEAPESLLDLIWRSLIRFINLTIESVGSKKDRHCCEVLILMLQALQRIISSDSLAPHKVLVLFEATVTGIPHRVLGSTSYQVGKMDVLNGTPALFLILLLYNSSMLSAFTKDNRFFHCLQTLVGCGLSGPTSPLAFGEAVLGAIRRSADTVQNKEQLWKMWSVVVNPLVDTITQTNEVNQGDALEHNFSAMHSALMLPVTHLLCDAQLQQGPQKSMLSTWAKLYRVFARCSALVVTAEENVCCEELCAKMAAAINKDHLKMPSTLGAVVTILQVMVECVDFSPYTAQFKQKLKSPHTPVNWMRKKNKILGNLFTFHSLLVQCLEVYLAVEDPESSSSTTGVTLASIISALFINLALAEAIKETLNCLIQPLSVFYKQAASELPKFTPQLQTKLEKLLCDIFGCLQTCSTFAYSDDLLELLSPLLCVLFLHKNKHFHTSVTQFWNATFANSISLIYPYGLRQILSQVKQNTPIILPSFQDLGVPDDLSGQYSSESSHLETKVSGMLVSSVDHQDLLLEKATELKDHSATVMTTPVSTRLDFGTPKPPHSEVLEEEASVDFVFIPPETKERVLTEHQKEVKRTKRVDIPAMYNNLDASLDSTAFTQYTQSQEDAMLNKLPSDQADVVTNEPTDKAILEDLENERVPKVLKVESQDYSRDNTTEKIVKNSMEEEMMQSSTAAVVESGIAAESINFESNQNTTPTMSDSSDLVSGTPTKPSSRRQSFITLEVYGEGKTPSTNNESIFQGPHTKLSDFSEPISSTQTSHLTTDQCPQVLPATEIKLQDPEGNDSESSQQTRVGAARISPPAVGLIIKIPTDVTADKEIIPDTQSDVETTEDNTADTDLKDMETYNQTEASEQTLDSSLCSVTQTSPTEPRRSGRCRIRPLLPGEDPEEREKKYILSKKKPIGEDRKGGSLRSTTADSPVQSRPNTRSKYTVEEDSSSERVRTRAQRDKSESSLSSSQARTKISSSQELRGKHGHTRRNTREEDTSQIDSQTEPQSDHDVHSHGQRNQRSRPLQTEERKMEKEVEVEKEESIQTRLHETRVPQSGERNNVVSNFQESEKEEDATEPCEKDSGITTPVPQNPNQDKTIESTEKTPNSLDCVTGSASPNLTHSSGGRKASKRLVHESKELVKDEHEMSESTKNTPEDFIKLSPSSEFDSSSQRRSKRKSLSEGTLSTIGQVQSRGRTRSGKGQELQSKPNPGITPESTKSSQGKSRYLRRKLSQGLVSGMESSESESPENRENSPLSNKRKRLQVQPVTSPLSLRTRGKKSDHLATDTCESSQDADSPVKTLKTNHLTEKIQHLPQSTSDIKEQSTANPGEVSQEKREADQTKSGRQQRTSPRKKKQRKLNSTFTSSSPGSDMEVLQDHEMLKDLSSDKESENMLLCASTATENSSGNCLSSLPCGSLPHEKTDSLHLKPSESSGEIIFQATDSDLQEPSGGPDEDRAQDNHSASSVKTQIECPNVVDTSQRKEEEFSCVAAGAPVSQGPAPNEMDSEGQGNGEDAVSLQMSKKDKLVCTVEAHHEDETQLVNMHTLTAGTDVDISLTNCYSASASSEFVDKNIPDSPVKQDLEDVKTSDVSHSPSGRSRGTWSPSASPSTSILKRSGKRPLDDDTPSPLVKSRRVSFASPIQQQELADYINLRSPTVEINSPRRSQTSSLPQPKYVSTPTKGLLILRPRNLRSPGCKSSKKSLISEMSREQQPVPKNCIYPALVGCFAPVEAVLPQITSNMWSRGFGQLVRARNIKTVGDLSSLTPSEIKTLPIRSPKLSNVKKALKTYEQQHLGHCGDDLKTLDETEKSASDSEDRSAPQTQDREDKSSGEPLATELVDESAVTNCSSTVTPDQPDDYARSELQALTCSMTSLELSRFSSQQLVELHDQLGGVMRRVAVELQRRVGSVDSTP